MKQPLLCDFHAHTTFSDGEMRLKEVMVPPMPEKNTTFLIILLYMAGATTASAKRLSTYLQINMMIDSLEVNLLPHSISSINIV